MKKVTNLPNSNLIQTSALGRVFNPRRYPIHGQVLWLAGGAGLLGLVASLLRGVGLWPAAGAAFNAFTAALLAWVLARELDPDRQWTALLALGLAGLASAALGPLGLLPSALMIVVQRMLVRTVGQPVRLSERLLVFAGGLGLMLWTGNFALGLALAATYGLDGALGEEEPGGRAQSGLLAVASLVGVLAFLWLRPLEGPAALDRTLALGLGLIGLLVLVRALSLRAVASRTDENDLPIQAKRVRAGRLAALLLGLLSLWFGEAGLWQLGPLWASLLVASF
jgi:hypothetical protein